MSFDKKLTTKEQDIIVELNNFAGQVYKLIDQLIVDDGSKIAQAMRYSALSPGKCLRSFLSYNIAKMYNKHELDNIYLLSAIIEIIHCYSLIHDDLPAMDDDDLRRNQLSCHKKFDEATAILAGDALLTIAFEIITGNQLNITYQRKCQLSNILAKAIGYKGMAGGQMLDLMFENKVLAKNDIIKMQKMKTANLFIVAANFASIAVDASNHDTKIFKYYAEKIGLAFQIIDDILDVISTKQTVGKQVNKDSNSGKATLVTKFSLEYAQKQANMLVNSAIKELLKLHCNGDTGSLKNLAEFVLMRKN